MIDFAGHHVVDLSPRMVGRITRLDGTVEEGNKDVFGLPWILEEGRVPYDDTLYTLIGGKEGDAYWPPGRVSGHCGGSHTEGGKGHMDHWEGLPDGILGLWEMPLDTFFGPAAVCYLDQLEPVEQENDEGELVKVGQPILPEHLKASARATSSSSAAPSATTSSPPCRRKRASGSPTRESSCWRSATPASASSPTSRPRSPTTHRPTATCWATTSRSATPS